MIPVPNLVRLLGLVLILCSFQSQAQVVINEIMAANSATIIDPDFNESADWIELYNTGGSELDLSGYYLTDNISDTVKWMIPAGTLIAANGYLLIWADGMNTNLHTIFKLGSIGEEVGLYDSDQNLLDSLIYPAQQTDISYGRTTDGDATWSWFAEATPAASNGNSTPYDGITNYQPFYSQGGGFFSAPLSIHLNALGGEIHYTLDGRAPTINDPIFTQDITFDTSTFIRARVFENGYIPGPIVTHSYFFDQSLEQRGLPVVSLVTDPDFFWDPTIGLYVQDFKPEWEHPLNIELFENDGNNQSVFNLQAGVKVNGLWSWQLPQKMLGIYFRNEYGSGSLDYPIFTDRDRYSYDEFILRASGSDWSYTLFRDGLCQSLVQENAPMYHQGFRQSIVFINGEYMGIHNMRSRSNGEELEELYGVTPGSYDIIANDGEVEEGSDLQYQFLNATLNSDLTQESNYNILDSILDITNFTDYWITEMWCGNSSWGHNLKMWKPLDAGKWQFIFGDLDRGFVGSTSDPLNVFLNPGYNDGYDYARTWLEHIVANQEYANYFAQRFADHVYTSFHPVRVNQVIDKFQTPLLPEIGYHVERWLGTTSNYGDAMSSVDFWENEVEVLRQYAEARQGFVMTDLKNTFGLGAIVSLGATSLPTAGGRIRLNEFVIPGSPWSGPYFTDMELSLTALPNPGYNFEGWSLYELTSVFDLGSEWKYLDDGSNPGQAWKQTGYNDSSWSSGNGEFGYGDGDENTIISYGPDANNKQISSYFRKTFEYNGDDSNPVSCVLNIRRDDGIVVYLNGIEIARSNMPNGAVDYQTNAIEAISAEGETALNEFFLDLPIINGTNIIAVEVHQVNGQSSDVSFDASLSILIPANEIISTENTITLTLSNDVGYIARYVPNGQCILPTEITEDLTLTVECSPYVASGDTYVHPDVTLTINPGVEVWFPEQARLIVQGDLQVNGTEEAGVLFRENSNFGAQSWGNVSFENSTAVNHLNYFETRNATEGEHPIHNRAAITGWFSEIVMDHITLTQNFSNPIFGEYSNFVLTNSTIHSDVTGDLINVKYGDGYISDCTFIGNDQPDTDAVDYDRVVDGIIRNSKIEGFYGFNSDAVDLGEECVNVLVENCLMNDCTDKGISIGQSSSAVVKNNTIVNCNLGLGIKDLGTATVDHLTLYSNVIGIECYEKNPGLGGGFVEVTNAIFSNSSLTPIFKDELSIVEATGCIYDTDTMIGETNSWMDPLFENPTMYNFHLGSASLAVNAGFDGENLGTLDHSFVSNPKLMISEIQYFSPDTADREFIRILNAGAEYIDLGNYYLTDAIDFVFPLGTWLGPDEKVTIVKDITFIPDFGGMIFQWTSGQLNNGGEKIVLHDKYGIVIDHVWYDNELPWPLLETQDQYLSLISPILDNHFASSWALLPLIISVAESAPTSIVAYPNPANDQIAFSSTQKIETLDVFDSSGRKVISKIGGGHFIQFDVQDFNSGVYVAIINGTNQEVFSVVR
jgi:parallel beta-helix repeat protein